MQCDRNQFIQKVCEQVGYKAAHKGIQQELEAHIEDNIEYFIVQGFDEKTAVQNATECMGDPTEIGKALNKIHRPQTEWYVISSVILLSILGVYTMFFIVDLPNRGNYIYCIRQIIYIILGIGLLIGLYFLDYMKYYKHCIVIFLFGILLTVTTLLLGTNENGMLYIKIGQITFTTAPICNILFLVCVIAELSKCKGKGIIAYLRINSLCALALISLFFNKAFTLCFIMLIVYVIIFTIATMKGHFNYEKRWNYICATCGTIAISLIIFISNKKSINFGLLNDEYSTNIVTKYLEGAQWIGKSAFLNANGCKGLPNNWLNYYLTIIIASFGWIVGCLILSFLITLFGVMISRTLKVNNTYGFYLSVAVTTFLIVNFILSILTMMGYISNLDCNLAFVSFGGTNYFNNIFVIGLFLSVWRRNLIVPSDMHTKLTHCN